jgi:transposase-like protein
MINNTLPTDMAEFKGEAVRLVTEYGAGLAEAIGNLGLNTQMLQYGIWELAARDHGAFRGEGRLSP